MISHSSTLGWRRARHIHSPICGAAAVELYRSTGLVDMEELEAAITPQTSIVSIMAVNNEIGVTQPIKEIGALCKAKKTFFHTDAAQAVGKVCPPPSPVRRIPLPCGPVLQLLGAWGRCPGVRV